MYVNKVSIELGGTVNLGDYENVKVSVIAEVTLKEGESETEALDLASEIVHKAAFVEIDNSLAGHWNPARIRARWMERLGVSEADPDPGDQAGFGLDEVLPDDSELNQIDGNSGAAASNFDPTDPYFSDPEDDDL